MAAGKIDLEGSLPTMAEALYTSIKKADLTAVRTLCVDEVARQVRWLARAAAHVRPHRPHRPSHAASHTMSHTMSPPTSCLAWQVAGQAAGVLAKGVEVGTMHVCTRTFAVFVDVKLAGGAPAVHKLVFDDEGLIKASDVFSGGA